MNLYLSRLAQEKKGVRDQLTCNYLGETPLPAAHPYGKDNFTISQSTRAEHMYPDVILVKTTNRCLDECAYCFRCFEKTTDPGDITPAEIRAIFGEYVPHYNSRSTTKIREVVITGGDPFILPIGLFEDVLIGAKTAGIELIRIHTRVTSFYPRLVTDKHVRMLGNYRPMIIAAQYNHADELTRESLGASEKLLNARIRMKSQSVLLRGVNDDHGTLDSLFWNLNMNDIQPYRLYHDMPVGLERFRTTVREGIELARRLKSTSGTLGHWEFSISTLLGNVVAPTEADILDEKLGADIVGIVNWKVDPNANYVKLRVTSTTTKEGKIPKEVWYQDGKPKSMSKR